MYLSKKEILGLENILSLIDFSVKTTPSQNEKDRLKELYFIATEIKDKAVKHRNDSLAYQKSSRMLSTEPRPVYRHCCVCGYDHLESKMRKLTSIEVSYKIGRKGQWICIHTHRMPYKIKSKLGRPKKV